MQICVIKCRLLMTMIPTSRNLFTHCSTSYASIVIPILIHTRIHREYLWSRVKLIIFINYTVGSHNILQTNKLRSLCCAWGTTSQPPCCYKIYKQGKIILLLWLVYAYSKAIEHVNPSIAKKKINSITYHNKAKRSRSFRSITVKLYTQQISL